jgi:hypothetical protein
VSTVEDTGIVWFPDRPRLFGRPELPQLPEFPETELITVTPWRDPSTIASVVTAAAAVVLVALALKERL